MKLVSNKWINKSSNGSRNNSHGKKEDINMILNAAFTQKGISNEFKKLMNTSNNNINSYNSVK
jgi:hypothetical protein